MYSHLLIILILLFLPNFAESVGLDKEFYNDNKEIAFNGKATENIEEEKILQNNAELLIAQLDPKAWDALEALLKFREKNYGENDPSLIPVLWTMAHFSIAKSEYDQAIIFLSRSLDIEEDFIKNSRFKLTEAGTAKLFQYLRIGENITYSFLAMRPKDKKIAELAMTVAYLRKGRMIEEVARSYEEFRRYGNDEVAKNIWEQLKKKRHEYKYYSFLEQFWDHDQSKYLKGLENEIELLEQSLINKTQLTQYTSDALKMNTNRSLALDSLNIGMPMGSTVVEIIQFSRYRFDEPGKIGIPGESEYIAIVNLRNGSRQGVPLGTASSIDATIRQFLNAISRPDTDPIPFAQEAYKLIVAPLVAYFNYNDGLNYVEQIIYWSVDGELNLVPFAALHDGKKFLLEKYRMRYITSARDVTLFSSGYAPKYSVKIFAAPKFTNSFAGIQIRKDKKDFTDELKKPLEHLLVEAENIKSVFPKADIWSDADAHKDAFLEMNAPGILHVATHSFFLDPPVSEDMADQSVILVASSAQASLKINPLSRSGLVFASSPVNGYSTSGLVTALDILGMDFEGTQLVVLSSCESGLGQLYAGQGIYGLRSSFLIAGAETIVTSLWRVSDAETKDLMTVYYRNVLDDVTKADAMDSAMCEIYRNSPHPFYWAPFVVTGKDNALVGNINSAIPPIKRTHGIKIGPATKSICESIEKK